MTAQTLAELLAEHRVQHDHIEEVSYCTCDGWFEGEWVEHLATVIEAWQAEQVVWEYTLEVTRGGLMSLGLTTCDRDVLERAIAGGLGDPAPRILRRPVVAWEVAP